MSQTNNEKNQWNSLQIQSDIKTIIGELEARIELIEGYELHTTNTNGRKLTDYTIGRLSAYKEFVEMLEEVLEE